MLISAASSSRSLWTPCALCQRLRSLTRELYHQCGSKSLRGPPSSSGLLLTDRSLNLCIVICAGQSFSNCLVSLKPVTYMEVPAPKATFLFRTSTWPWPSCWSWLYRGALSGNMIPFIPDSPVLTSSCSGNALWPQCSLCLFVTASPQSAAVCCAAAAAPVGKRHKRDGQRAFHSGNQRSSAAPPAALPQHTQQQGGARP